MIHKRILIIGGCGYLGSAIYRQLDNNKNSVVEGVPRLGRIYDTHELIHRTYYIDTVDLEWYSNVVNPFNIKEDYRNLSKEFVRGYDIVILLAAFSSPAMAVASDALTDGATERENYKNFKNLVEKLRPGQKFIYASTASLYNGIIEISTEDMPLQAPINVYDETKQACDDLMVNYPDIEYYSLRLGTVSGPSTHTRIDTSINSMTIAALDKHLVTVYNGDVRRAFVDINDLVRAIQAIVDSTENKRGVYNIASFNHTMNEIAIQVACAAHVPLEVTNQDVVENRLGRALPKTYDFAIDNKKFRDAFGFQYQGTVESIVNDIAREIDNIEQKTVRREGIKYD